MTGARYDSVANKIKKNHSICDYFLYACASNFFSVTTNNMKVKLLTSTS